MSPPVAAARPMKLPTSMCSGATRQSPPCSSVTPWMRRTFDSMPSIWAPSETRKRQRSWTCGSQAALPITVSPSASTAAMTTFSVAITLASSRKIDLPRSRGARISKRPLISISTPSSARPWMCGSSRRRPITSPPGGGTLAAPRRASSGPASRKDARMRRHSSSSSSDLCTPVGSIRISFSRSTRRRRRRRSGARPSSGRRGSEARCSVARAPRRAPWRRGSAARRSCSRPRGRCR